MFRCPIDLTDLGERENLDEFIIRKGGTELAVSYLGEVLRVEILCNMGLKSR